MEKVEVNTNLEYSRRKLADLKEYEGNARTHNKEQIMQIANSMMENGWTAPMLIDENDMILAGHGRKAAGEMLGVEEVPVMIIRGLNPAQKARLCISENQIALNAGWDTNKLSEQLQLILDDGLDLEINRRKIFMVSTPTIQSVSRIEYEYEQSDQRHYMVPCPYCNKRQSLKWKQIHWENNDPQTAVYICEHCGGIIEEHLKTWMLENGVWEKSNPSSKIAGFHLSSLYSPVGWFSWADAVKQFLDAKNKDNLLKVWVNTVLGETWLEKGEAPEWQILFDKREDYQQELIPSGGLFLTAGADVQKDRIECEVVAWGRNRESWSVGYFIINGDTAREDVWNELTDFSRRYFEHSSGAMLPISRFAIDSGFATQQVYNWVRKQPLNFAMAVKGTDSGVTPLGLPTKVDLNINGKKLRRGAKVWAVGTSILKSELYQFLRLTQNEDESFPAGYCHFPKYDSEYFKQLTAEQLVTKVVRGYQKREWQKTRERNEALDCRVYARAASISFGIEQFSETKWRNLEKALVPEKQEIAEISAKKKPKINFSPNIVKAQDPYL